MYFKIHRTSAFSFSQKKILLDYYGQPVANFKHRTFDHSFDVYLGSSSDSIAFSIYPNNSFVGVKLSATIINQATRARQTLYLRCDNALGMFIFNGHPKQGGQAIARMEKVSFFGPDEYTLQVAPGVDLAMVVFMVLAYDEVRERQQSSLA